MKNKGVLWQFYYQSLSCFLPGEAMSPPVLGTLIGLCLIYILPAHAREDAPPEPDLSDDALLKVVRLDDRKKGLHGLHMWTPMDTQSCAQCARPFVSGQQVYEWQTASHEIIHFHEDCIMTHVNKEEAEYDTLHTVRKLTSLTEVEILLESLFALEEDLLRLDSWPIDLDESEAEPQLKARRLM